ncbi:hypothetical protein WOLCODRAFT_151825 [Wolfiporia cocos MD-104 SS10]|uniref:Uncharacterized protein n=1 Tax=Wolfiporia cocos (strain MD-104) TaxID=742152 RepID=A0A2H3JSJ2_WOLCO|nr:hypothetical protein WOLCODRAFT_151825 [Wolfiporia cocos MD-104 SS10]
MHAYKNLISVLDDFCVDIMRQKKARKHGIGSIILSEIAHVSDEPLEPAHMLVKLLLPTASVITNAIPAHVYMIGHLPDARYDTSFVSWKDPEEIADHEIWASREAVQLRLDMMSERCCNIYPPTPF